LVCSQGIIFYEERGGERPTAGVLNIKTAGRLKKNGIQTSRTQGLGRYLPGAITLGAGDMTNGQHRDIKIAL